MTSTDPTPAAPAARLEELHRTIDLRVAAIRENQADWPCAKGCDRCCRQLADVPRLTAAEWALLRAGLEKLPRAMRDAIHERIVALGPDPVAPVVCPLLDRESGACPVYAQRPVACRTYGFYVQRGIGLYCGEIEARADEGELDAVTWGNQDAVARQLGAFGETRALSAWFAGWFAEPLAG